MTLEVSALKMRYDEPILHDVNLRLEPGQNGFLLGPSGAGKSTVLRCIAGLERSYGGTISWRGESLDACPPHRRGVGLLMQEPALFPHLNVWQNVAFSLRYRGVPRQDRRAEAQQFLDLVELADMSDRTVDALSGGQRQRVDLARTLAAKPHIILLDEPLSALDRPLRESLGPRICDMMRSQGVAALWVTHDESEAHRWGDKTWRIEAGINTAEGAPT